MSRISSIFVCFCYFLVLGITLASDPVHDPSKWDRIVLKYVRPGRLSHIDLHLVNYTGISRDPDFTSFLEDLKSAQITNLTRAEIYAFFSNVYNALAVNMIIENACKRDLFGKCGSIASIRDIGTIVPYKPVWGKKAGIVGGKEWSLDDVENYLRKPPAGMEEDPRLHSAIVCASVSCPNLRMEAYTVEKVDEQFTDNFRDFLNNTKKGMVVHRSSKVVKLSHIFNWFSSDFSDYAKRRNQSSVLDFVLMYLSPNHTDYQYLKDNKDSLKLEYFSYNWDVNAVGGPGCHISARPCYPLYALIATLVGFLILIIAVLVIWCCCCRKKKRHEYELVHDHH